MQRSLLILCPAFCFKLGIFLFVFQREKKMKNIFVETLLRKKKIKRTKGKEEEISMLRFVALRQLSFSCRISV